MAKTPDTRKPDTDPSAGDATPMDATAMGATGNGKPPYGKGSNFHGKPGRSGPPLDNSNNLRHGMKGGKLPKGCMYIEHRVNSLRRQVEAAMLELRGEISITDAAAVNSILKWERHGLLAAHWLRHEAGSLSASERLKFSEAIAKASDARDRNIRSLGLDVKPAPMPWLVAGNGTGHDVQRATPSQADGAGGTGDK